MQLKKLVIDLGSLAEGYKTAGQFVQIKVGDSKAGFFAIASPPDSNNQGLVEVLIKDGPPDSTANLLCNISAGIALLLDWLVDISMSICANFCSCISQVDVNMHCKTNLQLFVA